MSGPHMTDEVAERLRGLVLSIVKEIVDNPDQVRVAHDIGNGGVSLLFTVRTNRRDIGKVIGKCGRNATAIRTILEAIGAKRRVKVIFHVDDERRAPERGEDNAEGNIKEVSGRGDS